MNTRQNPCVDINCSVGGPHYHAMTYGPSEAHLMPLEEAIENIIKRTMLVTGSGYRHATPFDARDQILAVITHISSGNEWAKPE